MCKPHTSTISNIIKLFSILFMVFSFFFTDKSAVDIITVGVAISAVFLPVDVNKTIKNVREKRNEFTAN